MAEEVKKISFGFSKSVKKPVLKSIVPQEQKKVDYIECLDEKAIKVIGLEEKKEDEPLVIPLRGSKTWHDRIVNKIDADIYEPKIKSEENGKFVFIEVKEEPVEEEPMETDADALKIETADIKIEYQEAPKTLEEQAAREILQDLQSAESADGDKPNLYSLPLNESSSLAGEKEEMSEVNKNAGSGRTKRKNFSITDKLKILRELDRDGSKRAISEEYDIPARSLRNWVADRKKYEEYERTYQLSANSKRIKISVLDKLEEALYIWFDRTIKSGISLTGPLIMAKAKDLHMDLKIRKTFVASEGWLSNWKRKYDIRQYTRCGGEKLSANTVTVNNFKTDYAKTIEDEQLSLCQQFNADQTGLNFKMMPEKTLAGKSQLTPSGFKVNKDRVTIMLCSNADGTLKIPLVIIGKSANPRVLKNLSPSLLPVYYTHQKSAWMSAQIFERWFKDEFVPRVTAFLSKRRLPIKALLLVDDAPCHPSSEILATGDIKVKYLPPNSASIIQPINQGIIENLKRHYRSLFLHSILYAQKNGTDVNTYLKRINIKDIIYWVNDAWNSVTEETIFKCWKNVLPAHYYENVHGNLTHSVTNGKILSNVREINGYGNVDESCIQNWIHSEQDDICVPSNSELIAMVTADDTEVQDQADCSPRKSVDPEEAVSAADILLSFFEKNQSLSASELAVITRAKLLAKKIAISK